MSEPCSPLLWRRGRRSGPVLEVLGRRAGHIRSCASWGLQCLLEAGRSGRRTSHHVLTTREAEAQRVPRPSHRGRLGKRKSRGCRDPEVDCRGSEGAVGLVG